MRTRDRNERANAILSGARKYVICKVDGRRDARVVEDGAVYQRDGVIVEVGAYPELARKYDADEVLGSENHLVCPGFVNAHHHVGLTAFQMGTPDMALELWIAHRLRKRDVDLYLDTLPSFEMYLVGITRCSICTAAQRRLTACTRARTPASGVPYVGIRVPFLLTSLSDRTVYNPTGVSRRFPELHQTLRIINAQDLARGQFALFEALRASTQRRPCSYSSRRPTSTVFG